MDGIWKMPMQAQLAAVRSGALRAEALVQEYLKRLTRCGGPDGLNVLAELNPHVLEEARALDAQTARSGLLFGLPILVKDNIDVKGLHTTAGSFALRDNLAEHDAPVVRNLRRAGALILGKTNLTEFAHYTSSEMPNGFSSHGGQVYSAYGRDKDPGGSSTGSAVAVSAGLCAAAIGTDTSFSVIGCAADNGVTGLKPAHGSLSGRGIVPIASLLDSAGPLTRTFADAVQVYSAMRGEPLAPLRALEAGRLRLAVNIFQEEAVPEAQKALYRGVLDALRSWNPCAMWMPA
jgi:amidase